MPISKNVAIAAHHAAIETSDSAAKASASTMGHLIATIHIVTAMGVVMYRLMANVYANY
jgi:hypothetical protein